MAYGWANCDHVTTHADEYEIDAIMAWLSILWFCRQCGLISGLFAFGSQVPEKPKVYHPTLLQLRKWADKQRPLPDKEFGLLAKDLTHENDDGLHEELNYPNVPRFPRTLMQGF